MTGRGTTFTRSIGIRNVVHVTGGDVDGPSPGRNSPWSEPHEPRGTVRESLPRESMSRPASRRNPWVVNTVRKSSSLAFVPRGDHRRRVREAVRDQWVSAERVDRSRIISWKTREAWEKPRSLPVDVVPMPADEPSGLAVGEDPDAIKVDMDVRIFGGCRGILGDQRSLTGVWGISGMFRALSVAIVGFGLAKAGRRRIIKGLRNRIPGEFDLRVRSLAGSISRCPKWFDLKTTMPSVASTPMVCIRHRQCLPHE